MKIVVCVKQVPDTEARIKIGPDGKGIAENDLNWIVAPYDEFAIEEALKLKEAKGGEVVLISVGPDRVQSALRNGLAMGADSAIHMRDPLFDTLDSHGTAWALAAAIKPLGPDLILTGQQGVGTDNSQVPGMLAEILDLPQVTVAVKIEITDSKATVQREIEGADRDLGDDAARGPFRAEGPERAALREPQGHHGGQEEAHHGHGRGRRGAEGRGPRAQDPRRFHGAARRARSAVKMIEGDADTQVKELLRILHDEAKVL